MSSAEIGYRRIFVFLCFQPCSVACPNPCSLGGSAVCYPATSNGFQDLARLYAPSALCQLHRLGTLPVLSSALSLGQYKLLNTACRCPSREAAAKTQIGVFQMFSANMWSIWANASLQQQLFQRQNVLLAGTIASLWLWIASGTVILGLRVVVCFNILAPFSPAKFVVYCKSAFPYHPPHPPTPPPPNMDLEIKLMMQ